MRSRQHRTNSTHLPATLLLGFLLVSGATCATIRKQRSASDDGGSSLSSTRAGGEYDEEKLKIWGERIQDVIDNKLSGMCRAMVSAVKRQGETPESACSQLRNNKFFMRISCTAEDVENMEEAVCGYGSIVLPTGSSDGSTSGSLRPTTLASSSSSSSLSSPLPSTPSSVSSSSSPSSKSSFSSSSQLISSTNAKQSAPSNISPPPEEIALAPSSDDLIHENQRKDLPTRDSRLSEKCNRVVPHLVQVFSKNNRTRSGCTDLHRIAVVSSTQAERGDLITSSPEAKALLSACSPDDLHLLHGMLCAHPSRAHPEHALQGQQQKRVNYVIKTELTSSCRDAVFPLGENKMREDVEDSCLTLRGAQGEELVANDLCTRGDLDNLLKVVCNSSSTLGTLQLRTLVLALACWSYYVVVKRFRL